MPSKPPTSLAAALRTAFQLYQYILNSPDGLCESPQPTGEVSKVLRKFFGDRNKKSMREFLQAAEVCSTSTGGWEAAKAASDIKESESGGSPREESNLSCPACVCV